MVSVACLSDTREGLPSPTSPQHASAREGKVFNNFSLSCYGSVTHGGSPSPTAAVACLSKVREVSCGRTAEMQEHMARRTAGRVECPLNLSWQGGVPSQSQRLFLAFLRHVGGMRKMKDGGVGDWE